MNNETTLERPKPIVVVYLPTTIETGTGRMIGWNECREIADNFDKRNPDYYWFCILDQDAIKIEFKVFYEKDFTEVKYEELKTIINEAIEHQKNKTHE